MNEVLSAYYKQPVKGGFTNGGWPVILKADAPEDQPYNENTLVDGGMSKVLPSNIIDVLDTYEAHQNALQILLFTVDERTEREQNELPEN